MGALPIEIAAGVFWVGASRQDAPLNCNPYLIIDGEEAVLVDPGSPLDFESVLANVLKLISINSLKYIVLQHQDPDICASTPLFEKKGFQGRLVTHWRAAHLIKYYGATSPFYVVNEHDWSLTFGNHRTLSFIPTPYLHFPGAIATYDPQTRILFSSDLFGALSSASPLFADEWEEKNYMEAMKSFHEHYMPSNAILRPVMENFAQLDIQMIAPQHGAIIRSDISSHITALAELECGSLLNPLRRPLSPVDGYTHIVNQVLKRFQTTVPRNQLTEILAAGEVKIDSDTGLIADFNCSGKELWNLIFQLVYERLGLAPLLLVEPLVKKLMAEYAIDPPDIFRTTVLDLEQKVLLLNQDNLALQQQAKWLTEQLTASEKKLLRCSITKLRNEPVFQQYLAAECQIYMDTGVMKGSLLYIGVDNMADINLKYGNEVGDQILQTLTYMIDESIPVNHALFKLDGPVFACYAAIDEMNEVLRLAELVRFTIEQSDRMIEQITVSVIAMSLHDFANQGYKDCQVFATAVSGAAKSRLLLARQLGGNRIGVVGELDSSPMVGKILLVDTDELHLEMLGSMLSDLRYLVLKARDGDAAFQLIERENPEMIISEVMLPKMDAFLLRQQLRMHSGRRETPFILVSFQKNEENIQRAFALDIEHYFQKPYILSELIGLIQLIFRKRKELLQ